MEETNEWETWLFFILDQQINVRLAVSETKNKEHLHL